MHAEFSGYIPVADDVDIDFKFSDREMLDDPTRIVKVLDVYIIP